MKLVQVRKCDAACCKESPRFPDRRYKIPRCKYLKDNLCQIQSGERPIPKGESPIWPGRSSKDVFEDTCLNWPESSDPKLGETEGCCWQWVDDGI